MPKSISQLGNAPGERIRVLVCDVCRTMDVLPFRHPNEEGPDRFLEELVDKHNRARPHGDTAAFVFDTTKEQWENTQFRDKIIKELKARSPEGFLDLEIYAQRDSFVEDAGDCYSRHGRPAEGCIDYCDDSKLLGRPTVEGKEFQKENPKLAVATGPYLCWFCPVQSYVTMRQRSDAGLYN